MYFAVRNYWRGFFAAIVGAMFYRLMSVWFMGKSKSLVLEVMGGRDRYSQSRLELT